MEEDVSIHPELKMILAPFVRTLQEHRNAKVSALAPFTNHDSQVEWRDVESEDSESDGESNGEADETDMNLQEYVWPKTVGTLLEELSNMMNELGGVRQ